LIWMGKKLITIKIVTDYFVRNIFLKKQ